VALTSVCVVVDNRIRLAQGSIPPAVAEALCGLFVHRNPAYEKAARGNFGTKGLMPTDVTWRLESDGSLSFPRGGMGRVRAVLKGAGIQFTVVDARTVGEPVDPAYWEGVRHTMSLYDYQESAVIAMHAKQNCILRAPTGSGKTVAATGLIARVQVPSLVVVWTGNLFDQWIQRIEKELGVPRKHIGVIRGSKTKLAPITVAMQQSLWARKLTRDNPICRYFGLICADEVQRFAARTMFGAVDPFAARWRVGISADETRGDKREYLIYDLFGQVAYSIERDTLIDRGTIHEVQVCIVPTEFEWTRNFANPQDFNEMTDAMTADPARNALILGIVQREAADSNQQVILSHRVNHCLVLDRAINMAGVPSGCMTGEAGMGFDEAKAAMSAGTINVVVGTVQAMGTGVDLPSVARGMLVTPLAGNKQLFGQVWGRICRTALDKDGARLYYLWDRKVYGLGPVENLCRWNRDVLVHTPTGWKPGKQYLKEANAHARQRPDSSGLRGGEVLPDPVPHLHRGSVRGHDQDQAGGNA
jgi:superfamily II DNA or RNA helicase